MDLHEEIQVECAERGCDLSEHPDSMRGRVRLTRCHEDDSIVGYEGTCQKCGHSMTLAFCKDKD